MIKNFGPLNDADIASMVKGISLDGSEGSPPEVKFFKRAAEICSERFKKNDRGIAIFIGFETSVAKHLDNIKTASMPLLCSLEDSITNRIWFSDYGFSHPHECRESFVPTQENFLQLLSDFGFEDRITFVADLRSSNSPTVYLYPNGTGEDADPIQSKLLYDKPVCPEELKQRLDHFHGYIKTPSVAGRGHKLKIWSNSYQGIPGEYPEQQIQSRLLDSLRMAFLGHKVRAEGETDLGRCDVWISKQIEDNLGDPHTRVEWVLELKALTDKTHTGEPKAPSTVSKAVESGFKQAVSYKSCKGALNSALCCYDMRSVDSSTVELFKEVESDAEEANIFLWRWYLYRSSQAAREDFVG